MFTVLVCALLPLGARCLRGLRIDFGGHALEQRHHLGQLLLRLGQLLARRKSARRNAANAAWTGTLASKGEAASLSSCRDVTEPSLLGESASSARESSCLSSSAGTGVSSLIDAMSTGATRGDFGDVGVSSSFVCLAPMTSAQALATRKKHSMQNPSERDTYITLDHPTRIPQMLAVRDPRVDERPVHRRQARVPQVGERRDIIPGPLARRRPP